MVGFDALKVVLNSLGVLATRCGSGNLIVDVWNCLIIGRFVSSAVVESAVNDLNEYLFHQAMPMQKDIVVGITSDALSDSLTYGLHHTLTNALSDSLAADLTPPTMHYYYCVYCYYYGNFCDVCFKVSDRQLLHRQWWLGASEPGVVH